MDINKLCEERVLLAGEAEKEKETLACINKEIKKRKTTSVPPSAGGKPV